jgi:hypothetical protein
MKKFFGLASKGGLAKTLYTRCAIMRKNNMPCHGIGK